MNQKCNADTQLSQAVLRSLVIFWSTPGAKVSSNFRLGFKSTVQI